MTTPSSPPNAASSTAPSPPLATDEVAYEPQVFNACGLTGDEQRTIALGCGEQPAEVMHISTTDGVTVADQRGTPTGGTVMVDGAAFIVGQVGSLPDRNGQVLIVDAASGDVASVDLGTSRLSASAAGIDGAVVAADDGRVFSVDDSGVVKSLAMAPSAILGIAVDGDRIWLVQTGGDVSWFESSDPGTIHPVGRVQHPSRTGVVVSGDELWVLSGKKEIDRFSSEGAAGSIALGEAALSLASCADGVWVKYDDSSTAGLELLDGSGKSTKSWKPSEFPGYISCAGSGLWALSVDGHLLRSPK